MAGVADAAAVARATASAEKAQREWAAAPMTERVAVVRKVADLLHTHHDEIMGWMIRESGSIPPKADVEIHASIGQIDQAAGLISHPMGHVLPSMTPGRTSTARRTPLGVVGIITPWNFPIVLAMRSLAPALVLGNAVVLKSDPNTPVSGGVILARLFEEAGIPEGVLHVLGGGAEVGMAIVEDPRVRMISFTGSNRVGKLVGEAAGRGLKRIVLELGGNSPLIVLEDADIEAASSRRGLGLVPAPGPDLPGGEPAPRARVDRRGLPGGAERARRAPAGGQPRHRRGGPRPDHQREAGPARAADRRRDRRRRGLGADRRQGRRPVLPGDRPARRPARHGRVQGGDLRPGRAGDDVLAATRKRSSSRTRRSTAWRPRSSRGVRRAARRSPRACTPAWSTSTTRR